MTTPLIRVSSGPAPVGQIVRAPKTAEIIATSIRRGIVSGELKEGDTLPSELELMSQFGVSRPTLREAFRILETESLISIRRGSRGGAQVMAPDLSVAARYVGMLLQMSGTTIGEVYGARAIVEPAAAGMLANARTETDLADLQDTLDQLRTLSDQVERQSPGAVQAWAALSWQFHDLLVQRAGNRALAVQWAVLRDVTETHSASSIERGWDHPQTQETLRKTLRSYEKLIALVRDRDADGAVTHWTAHMKVSGRILAGNAESKAIVDLFD